MTIGRLPMKIPQSKLCCIWIDCTNNTYHFIHICSYSIFVCLKYTDLRFSFAFNMYTPVLSSYICVIAFAWSSSADLMMLPKAMTPEKKTPEPTIVMGMNINLLVWKAVTKPIPSPANKPIPKPWRPPYRKYVFLIFKSSLKRWNFLESLLLRSFLIRFLDFV